MTDIGLRIKLAGIERSDVNIFHNGYIYLLVKLGILGVLAYIYFVSRIVGIIRRNDRRVPFKDAELKKLKAILYLLLFFLICITWVFFGIFNNAIFNNIIILTIIVIFQYEYLTRMRIERFATVPGKV
jgi:O-antigen ligase